MGQHFVGLVEAVHEALLVGSRQLIVKVVSLGVWPLGDGDLTTGKAGLRASHRDELLGLTHQVVLLHSIVERETSFVHLLNLHVLVDLV